MAAIDYSSLPASCRVAVDGALRVLTLDRPGRRNAVDAAVHKALAEVWLMLGDDEDARALLIRAEGETFSAGGDFDWFLVQQEDPAEMEAAFRDGHRILKRMLACELPIVTAIQGAAVGIAASIGVLSDIVVMSEDAFYRDPHVALGMVAGDGAVAWPMSVGMQIAKQYVLLGDRLQAAEAYRLGMVNEVVPRTELESRARQYAERLAALPRRAAQSTKRMFTMQLERQIQAISDFALSEERLCVLEPEHAERVRGLTKKG